MSIGKKSKLTFPHVSLLNPIHPWFSLGSAADTQVHNDTHVQCSIFICFFFLIVKVSLSCRLPFYFPSIVSADVSNVPQSRDHCEQITRNFRLNIERWKSKQIDDKHRPHMHTSIVGNIHTRRHTRKKTIIVMLIYVNVCLFCRCNDAIKCGHRWCCCCCCCFP